MRVFIFLAFFAIANAATVRREKAQRTKLHTASSRFLIEGSHNMKQPIHEMMSHLALQRVRATYAWDFDNGYVVPYLRGNLWADDPSGDIFDYNDDTSDEWNFSFGAVYLDYVLGIWGCTIGRRRDNLDNLMYCRQHYGNLSFCHSMATKDCVCPHDVKSWILRWAKLCLDTGAGRLSACTWIGQWQHIGDGTGWAAVSSIFELHGAMGRAWFSPKEGADVCGCPRYQHLPYSFWWPHCSYGNMYTVGGRRRWWADPGTCRCTGYSTRNKNWDCPNCTTARNNWNTNTKRRAGGSLLHMIQDSFSYGHTVRGDVYNNGFTAAEQRCQSSSNEGASGTATADGKRNCGAVKTFNGYAPQDSDKHGKWDKPSGWIGWSWNGGDGAIFADGYTLCDGCTQSRTVYIKGQRGAIEAVYAGAQAMKQVRAGYSYNQAKYCFADNIWRLKGSGLQAAGPGMGQNPSGCNGCSPRISHTGTIGPVAAGVRRRRDRRRRNRRRRDRRRRDRRRRTRRRRWWR